MNKVEKGIILVSIFIGSAMGITNDKSFVYDLGNSEQYTRHIENMSKAFNAIGGGLAGGAAALGAISAVKALRRRKQKSKQTSSLTPADPQ